MSLRRGNYRKAFLTCRRHRIDLNILYDLDYRAFGGKIASFVEQIPEVDYLNLFVSGLRWVTVRWSLTYC
jgi:elongator complex protein 1